MVLSLWVLGKSEYYYSLCPKAPDTTKKQIRCLPFNHRCLINTLGSPSFNPLKNFVMLDFNGSGTFNLEITPTHSILFIILYFWIAKILLITAQLLNQLDLYPIAVLFVISFITTISTLPSRRQELVTWRKMYQNQCKGLWPLVLLLLLGGINLRLTGQTANINIIFNTFIFLSDYTLKCFLVDSYGWFLIFIQPDR